MSKETIESFERKKMFIDMYAHVFIQCLTDSIVRFGTEIKRTKKLHLHLDKISAKIISLSICRVFHQRKEEKNKMSVISSSSRSSC